MMPYTLSGSPLLIEALAHDEMTFLLVSDDLKILAHKTPSVLIGRQ